jgi:enoyl-CoA hydratase
MSQAAPAVLYEKAGDHVAVVTLNRPDARNAVDGDVARGLDAIVKQTEADDQIWAVVLTGAGVWPSAPARISRRSRPATGSPLTTPDGQLRPLRVRQAAQAVDRRGRWLRARRRLRDRVDLRHDRGVRGTRPSGLPEVERGLMAAAGGLFRLPRVLPRAVALELDRHRRAAGRPARACLRHGRPGGAAGAGQGRGAQARRCRLRKRADRDAGTLVVARQAFGSWTRPRCSA